MSRDWTPLKAVLRVATLVAAASAAACAALGPDAGWGAVRGEAAYPRSGVLLAGSVLQVQLLDVSRQDARAELIAETTIPLEGRRPPVGFRLAYRRDAIKPSSAYAVRATIRVGEQMLYSTTESYPVLTRDAPQDLSIRLQAVRAGATGPSW